MCKAPIPGAVKTRLTTFLSPEKAADLARCLAVDTARKAIAACENVIVAFSGEKILLESVLPENLIWLEQQGADLGERMHHALCFAFQRNFSPLVVVGTDSPTLPPEFIKNAIEILEQNRADVVLGETDDGGYYLVCLNQPNSQIFQGVRWSSPETFSQTARNCEQINLNLKTLPIWYDVDEAEDLRRLKKEIENNARLAPETSLWFEENSALFCSANERFAANIE
jgi:rSAM/selenodomain-associated transferase 1